MDNDQQSYIATTMTHLIFTVLIISEMRVKFKVCVHSAESKVEKI